MANPQDELEGLKTQVAALTARIYILEQRLGITAPAAPRPVVPPQPVTTTTTPTAPPKPVPPASVPTSTPPPSFATFSGSKLGSEIDSGASLERKIGQVWLNRIGIAAVLIGVSFFLKWAFDNNLIGAGGRVAIGLLAGIGIVVWSERFRRKNFVPFSYSLKAVGIGTLYLSLWGAAQYFDPPLISTQIAFLAMVVVTAATITMALAQNAELLAAFALVGGFTTPVLVSTGQNHEIVLFCYVAILDLGVLVIAIQKPWRRLLWGSFIGTQILFWGWFADYYSRDQRLTTVIFAALFATIFAAIPLASRFERSTRFSGVSITLVVVPLLNAAGFFLALFEMYESEKATLTWYALALAAAYLGLSNAFKQRLAAAEGKIINLIHIAVAIAFITIAIPLKLSHHWITMGWLVESAVLLWIAVRTRTDFLRYMAVAALVLGLFRLIAFPMYADRLVFNARFATYIIAVAVLGGIVYFGGRSASEGEKIFVRIAAVVLNLLALTALTLEASDYFGRQQARTYDVVGYSGDYEKFWLMREFSYSAIWLVYGAVLMAFGFWKKTAFVRWQGLALIALTILKVFIYDSRNLNTGYRILSFIALGAVLLAISFVYFKSSSRTPTKSSSETPG
ncbi:MAG TPA: DUF2339 domain-containing protein [Candidatus Angelobacter sp.]|nr:DUF2339 domain-containing protein [Candidatus Angelobacter sp.]